MLDPTGLKLSGVDGGFRQNLEKIGVKPCSLFVGGEGEVESLYHQAAL